jgi:hypothetical protein
MLMFILGLVGGYVLRAYKTEITEAIDRFVNH